MSDEEKNDLDEPPKSIKDFFEITDKAKCKIADCRSQLKTKAQSHLIRHIQIVHPSKLKEIGITSLSQTSPALIKEETLLLCVRHVTIHGRPFSSLLDESFQTLLKERLYYMNRNRAHKDRLVINIPVIQKKVVEISGKMKKFIENELIDKPLSFAMDSASRYLRSILGVNVLFIESGEVKLRTLMMEKITSRHTAKTLSKMFIDNLQEYSIPKSNVYAIATDNGRNMIATSKELDRLAQEEADEWCDNPAGLLSRLDGEYRQELLAEIVDEVYGSGGFQTCDFEHISVIRCGCHTFQLALRAALECSASTIELSLSVSKVIDTAREVVKELRNQVWVIELEKKNLPKPVLDNMTRWFSSYIMLSSLKKCKNFIEENESAVRSFQNGTIVLGLDEERPKKMKASLSEHEWLMIDEILQILEPAYAQSKRMQADQFTLTDFYGSWLCIKYNLREYQKRPNNVTDLAENLSSKMIAYEKDLFMNPLYATALFLHPRFAGILNGRQKIVARTKLAALYNRIKNKGQPNVDNNASNITNNAEIPDMTKAMDDYLDELSNTTNMSSVTTNNTVSAILDDDMLALEIEMNDFEQVEKIPWDANILKHWEMHKLTFPRLYLITQVVFAFPSSQASVERNFSSLTFILDQLRMRLGTDILRHILFIRNNKQVFEEVVQMQLAST